MLCCTVFVVLAVAVANAQIEQLGHTHFGSSGGTCDKPENYRQWVDVGQPCGSSSFCRNSFYHGLWRMWANSNGTVCQPDPTVKVTDVTKTTKFICVRDGSLKDGDTCIDWAACSSGWCSKDAGASYGICRPQKKEGEKCINADKGSLPAMRACEGLAGCAQDGLCHTMVGLGEACDASYHDVALAMKPESKLCPGFCRSGKCSLGKGGDLCDNHAQCESYSCISVSGPKTCSEPRTWDQECKTDVDCKASPGWLGLFATCGPAKKCIAVFSLGEGDKANQSPQCQWGTFFDKSKSQCVKSLACTKDTDCWSSSANLFAGVSCDCGNTKTCKWEINTKPENCVKTAQHLGHLPRTDAAQIDGFRTGNNFDENFRRFGDFSICECAQSSSWAQPPPLCRGEPDCADILDAEKVPCPDPTMGMRLSKFDCEFIYKCCHAVSASGPWCYATPQKRPSNGIQTCDKKEAGKCILGNMMSVFLPACEHSRKTAKCFQDSDCMMDMLGLCASQSSCPAQMPEYC